MGYSCKTQISNPMAGQWRCLEFGVLRASLFFIKLVKWKASVTDWSHDQKWGQRKDNEEFIKNTILI